MPTRFPLGLADSWLEGRLLLSGAGLTADVAPLPVVSPLSSSATAGLRSITLEIDTSGGDASSTNNPVAETSAPHATPATAQALPSAGNLTVVGTLAPVGSVAYFKVPVGPTSTAVRITLQWANPATNSRARLDVIDDLGTDTAVSLAGSATKPVTATAWVDASGSLTVGISPPAGSPGTSASGYVLRVQPSTPSTTTLGDLSGTDSDLFDVSSVVAVAPVTAVYEPAGNATAPGGVRLPLPAPTAPPVGGVIAPAHRERDAILNTNNAPSRSATPAPTRAVVTGRPTPVVTSDPSPLAPGDPETNARAGGADEPATAEAPAISPATLPALGVLTLAAPRAEEPMPSGLEPDVSLVPEPGLGLPAASPAGPWGVPDRERAELPSIDRATPRSPVVFRPDRAETRFPRFAALAKRTTLVVAGSVSTGLIVWGYVPLPRPGRRSDGDVED